MSNINTPSNAPSSNTEVKLSDSSGSSLASCLCCIIILFFFYPVIVILIASMQGIPIIGPNPYPTMYILGIPIVLKS
jgi:hypothetical protein